MKKSLILLVFALLSLLWSCEKYDTTYGTLIIEVDAKVKKEFRIDIYPHHNDELKHYYPVYSKEFYTRHATENVILSPGNYIVKVFGGTDQGVNIIGGKETKLLIDFR